ncbi:hypothetical protein ACFT8W_03665 [Streptomyces hygroscopicus]|uniref:hypothetical protein n=1 Tax=Streptomyces hygroscopicus TaxID=1912 RepID=UPI00362B2E19
MPSRKNDAADVPAADGCGHVQSGDDQAGVVSLSHRVAEQAAVHLQQGLDQRQERRSDTASAVVEEVGERVGEGAVFAKTPAE